MSNTSKLLWGEGLFLRPHHFQQQDAYHEARLQQVSSALHPHGWGIRHARIDAESLASGTLRLLHLSAIFADGEVYCAPDADELPAPLSLDGLPDDVGSSTIHLALPLLNSFGGNCNDASGPAQARFVQASSAANDLFTSAGEADVAMLRKLPRLLTDSQPRDPYTSMPLARVRRGTTGGFELDEDFCAPSLSLQACAPLFLRLRRLLDSLQAKSEALQGSHREPSKDIVEFRSGDIASFWLLHSVNAGFAALAHLHQQPGLHPERLHQELSRLAGTLLTFSKGRGLGDLPAYRHAEPGPGFEQLFTMIRELIDTVISARYFAIPLVESKPAHHLGRLDSQKIDAGTSLYLAVAADMAANELVSTVPVRFKVGAPDDVEKCVLSALPGVKLVHSSQVPAAIPVRPGNQYFALEARGPLYERMLKSQSAMIYVPSGIRELRIELLAVTQ